MQNLFFLSYVLVAHPYVKKLLRLDYEQNTYLKSLIYLVRERNQELETFLSGTKKTSTQL